MAYIARRQGMRSKWIEHKGKQIFYTDCTDFGYDSEALDAELQAACAVVCSQPQRSALVITDIRGTVASQEAMPIFKRAAVVTEPYAHKAAVIGITGYRKVLLDAVSIFSRRSLIPFNDLDEAKDWIVEE
jgi:hypothetical protein